ncbi:MAG: trypsin-like peptidase domain-containing protein [Candidatus Sungbacteria bacterium]|nr:trypsin-like peptidase domain-containing protein [Candidatus Sungbacteria bacterium]
MLAISFFTGSRPSQVIERIIEKVPGEKTTEKEISERVLRQDELVVKVVKRASPAVVSIVATKDVPVIERFFVNPFEGDPFLERFFGGGLGVPQFRQKGTAKQEVGAGTGFIVSEDGLILTNKHVVADTGAEYTVFLNDGSKAAAKVLARDPVQDLAVLKIERGGLPTVALGDSSGVEIGQTVVAIGNALGQFSNTVSVGVISGLHRTLVASGPGVAAEQLQELMQTDAAINPGNSGGPLLNIRGEVVAINTAMASGAENIGFAIPINRAKRDIESVKSSGRIIYPFLGVNYVLVTKGVKEQKKLAVDYGALILGENGASGVVKDSPADKAGLKSGDIILELGGERISADRPLSSLIEKHRVGEAVALKVLRGTETLNLQATLEERK